MNWYSARKICSSTAFAALCAIAQIQGIAQDSIAPQGARAPLSQSVVAEPAAGAAANSGANAEVLKELQQMRERIAQLEAQLKAQQAGTPGLVNAAVTNVQPATACKQFPGKTHSSIARQHGTGHQSPKPAAPFAFADWTWLNGTARNKDTVWDSEFFTPEIRFDANYISSFNHPSGLQHRGIDRDFSLQ